MGLPANWDSSTVSVDPWVLHSSAASVTDAVKAILGELSGIMGVLKELRISWTGESAELADQFNDRWEQAMKQLYGTKADPGAGILNVLSAGIGAAAVNYSRGERQVSNMFARFEAALKGIDPGTHGNDDSDIEDVLAKAERAPQPDKPHTPEAPSDKDITDHVSNGYQHTTSVDEKF
jgi:uncharacterized protein YukE